MLNKSFDMIYFHFNFFSKKIVKNKVGFFRFGSKVVLDWSKTHYLGQTHSRFPNYLWMFDTE